MSTAVDDNLTKATSATDKPDAGKFTSVNHSMDESAPEYAPIKSGVRVPVIVLGGEANALSVARDLGSMGVKVYAIGEAASCVKSSRYCQWVVPPKTGSSVKSWTDFLLGNDSEYLRGAVLLACSDSGLQVLIPNRRELSKKYRLDISNTQAQNEMLDKLTTYKHAIKSNTPVPKFWEVSTKEQVAAVKDQLVYPLLVKPRLSHLFEAKFGRKHLTAENYEQVLNAFSAATDAQMDMLLMELIPGDDDQLCSYFTYLDEQGQPMWHFTKRVIRRFPAGMGGACYHVTDWIPEIIDQSMRLFAQVGLRGLANVEYKRDHRDGQYKLIECNARFTASNCLVSAAGFSLARYVYCRLVNLPLPPMKEYKKGLRLWDPIRDFWAYRERKKLGQLTFGKWLVSIMHFQTSAYFRWTDPMPTIQRFLKPLTKKFKRG